MRKEYVVVRIDAAPDAAPYVVVSLSSKKDMQEKDGPLSSPFGKANVMGFSNMNDMAKELNKMMTGSGQRGKKRGRTGGGRVGGDLGLSGGDKVFLELSKAESSGV